MLCLQSAMYKFSNLTSFIRLQRKIKNIYNNFKIHDVNNSWVLFIEILAWNVALDNAG